MAKILHTADIHLREQGDERWQALETILKTAAKLNADAVTIGGDLFDQNVNAQNLRDKLRALFSQQKFQVIILPGNHDINSFEAGLYFGDNVILLTGINQQINLDDQTTVSGIPFEPLSVSDLLKKIQEINDRLNPKHTNILLFHGELTDIFFSSADFGDEGQKRYLPLKLNLLVDTHFDYLLAGHFHTKFHLKRLPNQRMKQGGFFNYPGSPVSITSKEIGVRKVALIEPGKPPQEIELDTGYYQPVQLHLTPNDTQQKITKLEEKLKQLPKNAIGICQVTGFFDQNKLNLSETQLKTELDKLFTKHQATMKPEDFKTKDISFIAESGLYQTFLKELQQTKLNAQDQQVLEEKLINALIQVNS